MEVIATILYILLLSSSGSKSRTLAALGRTIRNQKMTARGRLDEFGSERRLAVGVLTTAQRRQRDVRRKQVLATTRYKGYRTHDVVVRRATYCELAEIDVCQSANSRHRMEASHEA